MVRKKRERQMGLAGAGDLVHSNKNEEAPEELELGE